MTHPSTFRSIAASTFLLWGLALQATAPSRTVSVSGETVYYDNGTHSRDECMLLAAEQARVEALAREFGTIVTQEIIQTDRIVANRESSDFLMLSGTEVKGEWLGDIEPPKYEFSVAPDGTMIVKCSVRGNARAISNEAVEFETYVLRNGTDKRNADTHFMDGDDMCLYFLGSTDGSLSVWLEDQSHTVYALLPYPGDPRGKVYLKANKPYTFFSSRCGKGEFGPEEELILTAPEHTEYNRIYVVYSPDNYSRPPMQAVSAIPSLPSADFNKWLMKVRRTDPRLAVKSINIEISPK